MSTVVSLPEKRHDLGQELFPEPPPEKRAKLTAMESKSAEEAKAGEGSSAHTRRVPKFVVCDICRTNGHTAGIALIDHREWDWAVFIVTVPAKRKMTIIVSTSLWKWSNTVSYVGRWLWNQSLQRKLRLVKALQLIPVEYPSLSSVTSVVPMVTHAGIALIDYREWDWAVDIVTVPAKRKMTILVSTGLLKWSKTVSYVGRWVNTGLMNAPIGLMVMVTMTMPMILAMMGFRGSHDSWLQMCCRS
ncbi:hypothetical protein ACS0TY_025341 [Phlomoides rotata]